MANQTLFNSVMIPALAAASVFAGVAAFALPAAAHPMWNRWDAPANPCAFHRCGGLEPRYERINPLAALVATVIVAIVEDQRGQNMNGWQRVRCYQAGDNIVNGMMVRLNQPACLWTRNGQFRWISVVED